MPLGARRFIYALLAGLGFLMMVPPVVNMQRLQAELMADPFAVETALDPAGAAQLQSLMLLFLVGAAIATGFLYAALSAGYARAWRPRENGPPRCRRCDAELALGVRRCPTCDQQLAW
ncbi:MAG: hypothetical protein PVJ43_03250 [Gemmatimonadales bacterium]|jgi:hypothetical protein